MADVSKFQMPNGETYTVKDVVGRTTASAAQSTANAAQSTAAEALEKANQAFSVSYADETITFANIGGA